MKFVFVKCVAFAVTFVGQLAAADSGINLSGAVSAALGDGKENAAEKRQRQRDERRSYTNPNRSQADEDRETRRKERQYRNSGRENPKNNRSFQQDRNARNRRDCEDYGENCNYSADTDDYGRDDYRNDDNRYDDLSSFGSAANEKDIDAVDIGIHLRGAVSAALGDGKENAAEKRQRQRDERRSYTNPNRSQADEDRETRRKERQYRNSGRENPKNNRSFQQDRNARNRRDCEDYGENCNYSADTDDYGNDDYRHDDFVLFGRELAATKEDVMIARDRSSRGVNRNNKLGKRKDSVSPKRAGQRNKRRTYTRK